MSSYGSYSDSYEESESESPRARRRRREKQEKTRDKKRHKKDKRRHKREKRRMKRERKRHKKERKRRRSQSGSSSRSGSCSRSRSRVRPQPRPRSPMRTMPLAVRREAPRPARRARSRSRSPAPAALPAPRSPMKLPEGRPLTLAEACEAAGRGVTTGEVVTDNEVRVVGPDEEPADVDKYKTFEDAVAFPRELREELKRAGFPGPSQIQAWTWPLGLRGKDIIGIAATGSGKTLAFLLPAFTEMLDAGHRPEREGAGLLVMSPTRELAQQTELEASRFGKCLGLRCVALYGGAPKGNQMAKYRQGCHTIVACPGRLNDFLEGGQVRLENVRKLVLDEADRMLDMGFEPQIRKILAKVPRKRHTLFFTATWPREVRQLAAEILTRPYKVMIGNRDTLKGNQDITQQVRIIDGMSKNRELEQLLREAGLTTMHSAGKALVFCNTKRMCEQLSNTLIRAGLPCTSIHGDKDQGQRDAALDGLKRGRFKVLVATDVAARGLDIKGVGLVVNYDPANNAEDYVHRIGRTARAGAKGYAVTLLTSLDGPKARGMIEVMERTDQVVTEELREFAGSGGGRGGFSRHRGGRGGGSGGGGAGGFGLRGRSRSVSRSPRL